MASVNPEYPPHEREVETDTQVTKNAAAGGSVVEAVGGIAAVVLAIIGLANVFPVYLMAIAVIIVGGALIFEGGSLVARFTNIASQRAMGAMSREATTEFEGGMSADVIGGIAGIVLGILALIGLVPEVLSAAALVVFAGALMLSSSTTARLSRLSARRNRSFEGEVAHEVVMSSVGTQAFVGLGALVLGILSLVGIAPVILTLVGLLGIGTSLLLAGSLITGRMVSTPSTLS